MNYKCPIHLTPLKNAVICQVCIDGLHRNLGDIAALHDELEITSTRQNVSGQRAGSRSTTRPLPFDWSSDHDSDDLHGTLVGWVRDLEPDPDKQPEDNDAALSRWLIAHLPEIAQHPAADEIVDEIGYAVRQAYRAIDNRAERWYAGPCRAEYAANSEDNDACCMADLYVKPDADISVCRHCGAPHNIKARREWLLDAVEDMLATATMIARGVSRLDEHVTPERIRQWAARGRIAAKGVDLRGHPTYRVGDVLDRLHEDLDRATRRKPKTAAA